MAKVKGLKKRERMEKRERERERGMNLKLQSRLGSHREGRTLTELAPLNLAPSRDDFTKITLAYLGLAVRNLCNHYSLLLLQ